MFWTTTCRIPLLLYPSETWGEGYNLTSLKTFVFILSVLFLIKLLSLSLPSRIKTWTIFLCDDGWSVTFIHHIETFLMSYVLSKSSINVTPISSSRLWQSPLLRQSSGSLLVLFTEVIPLSLSKNINKFRENHGRVYKKTSVTKFDR